jgi:hypothetical protein
MGPSERDLGPVRSGPVRPTVSESARARVRGISRAADAANQDPI